MVWRITPKFTWSGAIWNPNIISGLSLWLDAADASTITTVSGAVSQWLDKSGNNRNVVQQTSGNRPSLQSNSLNGLPGIDYGTSIGNKVLAASTTGYSPVVFFVVADYDGPSPFNSYSCLLAPNNGNSTYVLTQNTGSNWFGYQQKINTEAASFTALPAIASPFILETSITFESSVTNIQIGNQSASFSRNWLGKIYEVLSLSFSPQTLERQRIEGYLAHKWGLTANLPSNHPYKNSPPMP